MKRKFLEDLGLEKKDIDAIMEINGQDIENAKGELTKVQADLDTANKTIETLQGQVKERDGQLETIKNSPDNPETLKSTIATLQAENKKKDEEHAAEIKQLKINAAIETAISGAKGKNAKAIKALLDMTKVDVDKDGNVIGHTEQIMALTKAEDSKFLFDIDTKKTKIKGAEPGEPGNESGDGNVDISKMTYSELAAYMEENPDVKID
nr:phage scaffolding protein [uncultured Anaerocolumna sp.]